MKCGCWVKLHSDNKTERYVPCGNKTKGAFKCDGDLKVSLNIEQPCSHAAREDVLSFYYRCEKCSRSMYDLPSVGAPKSVYELESFIQRILDDMD